MAVRWCGCFFKISVVSQDGVKVLRKDIGYARDFGQYSYFETRASLMLLSLFFINFILSFQWLYTGDSENRYFVHRPPEIHYQVLMEWSRLQSISSFKKSLAHYGNTQFRSFVFPIVADSHTGRRLVFNLEHYLVFTPSMQRMETWNLYEFRNLTLSNCRFIKALRYSPVVRTRSINILQLDPASVSGNRG